MLSKSSVEAPFLSRSLISAATFFAAVFVCSPASADPQATAQRGRLPDGRAYRIDAQGMRLVDYIADLEVTNDDLKRQVDALELETAVQQRKLEQSGDNTGAGSSLREADLIKRKPEKDSGLPAAATQAQSSCPPLNCDAAIAPANARIAQLQEQLRAQQAIPAPKCDYASAEAPLREQIKMLQGKLAENPSKEDFAIAEQKRTDLYSEASQLKEELASIKADNQELQKSNSQQSKQIASLQAEIDSKTEQLALAKTQSPRAALASTSPSEAESLTAKRDNAGTQNSSRETATVKTPANSSNTLALRSEFRNELEKIQSLVIKRKNLLDAAKARGKGVSISIQPLVTKSGSSLDSLRMSSERFTTDAEAENIRNGLREIESILSDDVSVLTRLSHLS